MAGVAEDHPSRGGRDGSHDRSGDPVFDERVEEAVQRRQHLGRGEACHGIGADGAAHLTHEGCGRCALAHDVAHAEEHGVITELEDVVPVTPGVGPGDPRTVFGIEQQALDIGQRVRQNGPLQHVRHDMLPLEPRGIGQGDTGATRHLGGQRHIVGLEDPSRPVHEGHHADDLAVDGQRHAQCRGDAWCFAAALTAAERSQLCPAAAEGNSGRCIGFERKYVAAPAGRVRTVLRGRPRFPYVESHEPALSGHLDRARVSQTALHEAHGAPDDGGGLEARAQQTGHLRKKRQPITCGLGVAECLTFVLEHLGPLHRLRREPGQRREEPQIGLVRLGLGDKGE